MRLPEKADVWETLLASLRASLEAMAASAESDRAGATHAENRQEGAKDMRATEQSYIARGKAMRAEELADELGRIEQLAMPRLGDDTPIVAGALVHLAVEDEDKLVLLLPAAGGTKITVSEQTITVITPASPIGRALLGKRVGDDFVLRGREHVVEAVA